MPPIHLPATPPTFQEYQLIHQTQQRQRNPDQMPKPVTSDSWKQKLFLWLGLLAVAVGRSIIQPASAFGNILVFSFFTCVGLLHQWWEYRQAFRQYREQPQPLGFRVSETGLAVQWPYDWQFLPWSALTRVQQVGDWLLLYPGPDFCYYLDLRRVPEPYTAIDVLALIGQREGRVPAATFAS